MNFINENRRLIIALMVGLGIYLTVSELVFPFYDRQQAAIQTVGEKEDQLRKYRRALVRKGNHANLIQDSQKNLAELETHFIGSGRDLKSSSELQSIVEQVAGKVGVALTQRSVAEPKKKDNWLSETSMMLVFECQPAQLAQFLAELHNNPKCLNITSLQVTPAETLLAAPKDGSVQKNLRINMTVTAPSLIPNKSRKG
jgi:Tfp pilus assembly protein PilO